MRTLPCSSTTTCSPAGTRAHLRSRSGTSCATRSSCASSRLHPEVLLMKIRGDTRRRCISGKDQRQDAVRVARAVPEPDKVHRRRRQRRQEAPEAHRAANAGRHPSTRRCRSRWPTSPSCCQRLRQADPHRLPASSPTAPRSRLPQVRRRVSHEHRNHIAFPRLKAKYNDEIRAAAARSARARATSWKSHASRRSCINSGVGTGRSASRRSSRVRPTDLERHRRPEAVIVTEAKKSIAGFKLRRGQCHRREGHPSR